MATRACYDLSRRLDVRWGDGWVGVVLDDWPYVNLNPLESVFAEIS